jgi:hypothetical protein
MPDPARPPRQLLTEAEAQAIAEDLRKGRRDRIEDARFPERFQLRLGTLRDVSIVNSHLWLTIGGGMFRGGVMEGCEFVDVDLDPLTVFGSEMRTNTFERVTFGAETMGGIIDSVIDGGTFRACRFLDFGFRKARIRGVTIDGGRLDRVRFESCTFTDVRLASSLRNVALAASSFAGTDMSDSDVVDVTFDEWGPADLWLPERRTGFFVTPAAASEALATVTADLSAAFRQRVLADVISAGYDLVAVSERFFTRDLGAGPVEASLLVDALFPHRLDALEGVSRDGSAARRGPLL